LTPTIVRIIFVVLALAGGPGLVLYIILAIVVPEEP
jgi:phage shock protein PspC (stress-responsive transcriptional regulator)